MKIEFEIQDISREEVCDAIARQLLTTMVKEYDPESGEYEYHRRSDFAEILGKHIEQKIEALADKAVREQFDATIKERISKTVDQVLADGWVKTDNYGNANGERLDLKGRINEILTKKESAGYNRESWTLSEKLVREKVEEVLRGDLNKASQEAQAALRKQLDTAVTTKVAETIKSALGLR